MDWFLHDNGPVMKGLKVTVGFNTEILVELQNIHIQQQCLCIQPQISDG